MSSTRFNIPRGSNRDDSSNVSRSSMDSQQATGSSGNIDDDQKLGLAVQADKMHRKAVKKGFNFTILVVGESGLGKSTLIRSMFLQDLYQNREFCSAQQRLSKTTTIEKHNFELDEKGIKLRLTVVDTPGFYDAVDATNCWQPIEEYIDGTFDQYFKDECGINRKNITDNRVHCCLYFVSPFGRGLRPIDVELMRRLHRKVNLVPIIAKADALTQAELAKFKQRVLADLERYKIEAYRPPECDSDEDEDFKRSDSEIKRCMPFAVIGGSALATMADSEGGKRALRSREYPWGSLEIDNANHCDFKLLRLFLLRTHMQDLKDMTRDVHYENYRANYITVRMCRRQNDRSAGQILEGNADGGKSKDEERVQQMMEKIQNPMKIAPGVPGITPSA